MFLPDLLEAMDNIRLYQRAEIIVDIDRRCVRCDLTFKVCKINAEIVMDTIEYRAHAVGKGMDHSIAGKSRDKDLLIRDQLAELPDAASPAVDIQRMKNGKIIKDRVFFPEELSDFQIEIISVRCLSFHV